MDGGVGTWACDREGELGVPCLRAPFPHPGPQHVLLKPSCLRVHACPPISGEGSLVTRLSPSPHAPDLEGGCDHE